MTFGAQDGPIRRSEIVATLSLAADLGMAQPLEHSLRTCLLSVNFGEALGLPESALTDLHSVALLRWSGCTANAHETALLFGDDLEFREALLGRQPETNRAALALLLGHAMRGRSPLRRLEGLARLVAAGPGGGAQLAAAHCEVAERLATDIGLGSSVSAALGSVFERWDGRGAPARRAGAEIPLPTRIATMAGDVEIMAREAGIEAACEVLRHRAGGAYDPELAREFAGWAVGAWEALPTGSAWDGVQACASDRRPLSDDEADDALRALAHFADLKSPYTARHSVGVAELASAAAEVCGLPADDVQLARRAGWVHDLGRAGVSNAVWDKPEALSFGEREQVRLHPYHTERVLSRSPSLARLAAVASHHHERVDGSGYPHGRRAPDLPPVARLLAAADVYAALGENRPHRTAFSTGDAARELREEARAGRLESSAVEAVLEAAGHPRRRRPTGPAGLTDREIEVLALLAGGLTNRQIAQRLTLSVKTVGHHVEHAYIKIGVNTRAGATLFALNHDLV